MGEFRRVTIWVAIPGLAKAVCVGRYVEGDLFVGVIPVVQLGFAVEAHPSAARAGRMPAGHQRFAAVLAAPTDLGQVVTFAESERHRSAMRRRRAIASEGGEV